MECHAAIDSDKEALQRTSGQKCRIERLYIIVSVVIDYIYLRAWFDIYI